MRKIDLEEQKRTPYIDAYRKYIKSNPNCFNVPGHHKGNIKTDFDKIFHHSVYKNDINCPYGMDNIMQPTGCIKEAEELFAKACKADQARFLVNGSTSGNLIMIISTLKPDDKIILPRNVHKSVINALILSKANPIFMVPHIDKETGISGQIGLEERKKAIDDNLDAKAIFIINPTYFGETTNLKQVVEYAHLKRMIVLVDEAHGSHFYFKDNQPITAMEAGADMSTLSIHKTGGSLTQSSVLLINEKNINLYDVDKAFNMLTTTSPSSLLLASLDGARKYLVFNGDKEINKAIVLAKSLINKLDKIKGIYALGKEYFINKKSYDYDETKVVIKIDKLSINGFDIYKLLKEKYNIQVELAEANVFLCVFSIGSTSKDVSKLVKALKDISKKYYNPKGQTNDNYNIKSFPKKMFSPHDVYHQPLKVVPLKDAKGFVSKESIIIYPPGIPLILPGEVFDEDVIKQLTYYQNSNAIIVSEHKNCENVSVVKKLIKR